MNRSKTTVPVELLKKYDRPGPRYTSYPTAPVWNEQVNADSYRKTLGSSSTDKEQPLAVYNHIPFCVRRCYYCGCNTVVTRRSDRVTDYVDCLTAEIDQVASDLGERNKVAQCHFGGGTPTYLDTGQFNAVMDKLEERFEFLPEAEVSIEIDPRVTTPEQLEQLRARGFNRISLGVQDFNPEVQAACGRKQEFELVDNLIKCGRKLGFRGINIDLIYGLPKQTPQTFAASMDQALQLQPDRVAVYSFAYLPGMKANQRKIEESDLPTTDIKYQLFAIAIEKFLGAGYQQIGMDHFALSNDELSLAQSDGRLHRNFMGYTVQSAEEMIGFGMSSIGYIGNSFFQNFSSLDKYKGAISEGKLAVYRGIKLTRDDLMRQFVINSLMCNFRLDYAAFESKFGTSYHDYFSTEHAKLTEFASDTFIDETGQALVITPLGRTFVRNIAMTYDAYLNKGAVKGPKFSRTI